VGEQKMMKDGGGAENRQHRTDVVTSCRKKTKNC